MKRYTSWIVGAVVVVLVVLAGASLMRAKLFPANETTQPLVIPADPSDGSAPPVAAETESRPKGQAVRGSKAAPFPASAPIVADKYPVSQGVEGTPSWTMIAILLMSMVAAALIGGLVVGWWIKDPLKGLAELKRRVDKLEQASPRPEPSPTPRQARDDRDPFAIYRTPLRESPPPAQSRAREPRVAPMPPTPPAVPLSQIIADYRRLLAGTMSRSSFKEFFETIGEAQPVQLTPDRGSIEQATSESFLTAVARESGVLVFPSYDFASNAANQFSTIASVPEAVSILFDLERDAGEIVMDRPAIFDHDADRPILRSKGVLRGFDG